MKGPDCSSAYAQPNAFLGSGPEFSIIASQIIPEGYMHSFCYSCIVTPTGLPPIAPFTKQISVV